MHYKHMLKLGESYHDHFMPDSYNNLELFMLTDPYFNLLKVLGNHRRQQMSENESKIVKSESKP